MTMSISVAYSMSHTLMLSIMPAKRNLPSDSNQNFYTGVVSGGAVEQIYLNKVGL
jgi:hypothetical protein